MNTKKGAKKARETLIKRLGGPEKYKEYMREIATRGHIKREDTTFYKNREIASLAGKKGKRGKKDQPSEG